jgi:WD40 repeat protein
MFIVGSQPWIPLYESSTGEFQRSLFEIGPGPSLAVQAFFTPDNSTVIVARSRLNMATESGDAEISRWTLETNDFELLIGNLAALTRDLQGNLGSFDMSRDGRLLALGLWNGTGEDPGVFVWDYPAMTQRCHFPGNRVSLSPDGNKAATLDDLFVLRVFDSDSCDLLVTTNGYPPLLSNLNFSFNGDGTLLAYSAFTCCAIQLLDLATGEIIHTERIPGDLIENLSFSPNGEFLLATIIYSAAENDMLTIWKLN